MRKYLDYFNLEKGQVSQICNAWNIRRGIEESNIKLCSHSVKWNKWVAEN